MNVFLRMLLTGIPVTGIAILGVGLTACDRLSLQNTFSPDPNASQWKSAHPSSSTSPAILNPTPIGTTSLAPNPSIAVTSPTVNPNPLTQVPQTLQPYVKDVLQLDKTDALIGSGTGGAVFAPNQAVSRATFARWLVGINNRIYRDRPARQIRLGVATQPAFQDVPSQHADFAAIQGLAEAGYIPSVLSGDSAQTRFRPNEVLTRETLLLWKVPVDRQQILPTVSAERVKQLWGFKDAGRITPLALSGVAADHSNGDLANIRRVLGSTLLFQPQKPVTQAEAIAALWFVGIEGDSFSVQDLMRSEMRSEPQATTQGDRSTPDTMPTPPLGPPLPKSKGSP